MNESRAREASGDGRCGACMPCVIPSRPIQNLHSMSISEEHKSYIGKLAFGLVDPSLAFGIFDAIHREGWQDFGDYLSGITLLGYAEGRPHNLSDVCDFLQECITSPSIAVRHSACMVGLPRVLRRSEVARKQFVPQIKLIASTDLDASVKKAASFALQFATPGFSLGKPPVQNSQS